VVICLERGADLHTAHLMPLPLTVSCFSKVQIGFTFLVPAHPGSPGKRAVKRVCLSIYLLVYLLPCCCIFRQRSPAVHRVITHYACPWPLIATRWFICLYVDVMPTEVFTDGFHLVVFGPEWIALSCVCFNRRLAITSNTIKGIYNARMVSRRAESEAQAVARGKDGEAQV